MNPAVTHPLQLALGFAIWSVWFVAAYAALSLGCSLAPPADAASARTWINASLGVATLATVLLLLVLAWRCWRGRDTAAAGQPGHFVAPLAAALHLAAALATLFVGLPLVAIPPCV